MSLIQELLNNGVDVEEVEKLASVQLFSETCAANEIDLNELNDGQIDELYAHWADGEVAEKNASYELEKEAAAKLAEADYLGRHMARSFHDELTKQGAAPHAGQGVIGNIGRAIKDYGPAAAGLGAVGAAGAAGGAAAGTAAGAGGTLAAQKMKKKYDKYKEKKSSAPGAYYLDKLATAKANEFIEQGHVEGATDSDELTLEDVVNLRAIELLQEHGYEIE